MNFTFGIITNYGQFLNTIIDSIEKQNIPNYEIIIVGNCDIERNNTKVISFDENIKMNWITKKKNIITKESKYELDGWYEGHLKFGNGFYVLMDKIINYDNSRFRDWTLWENNGCRNLLPYDITNLSKIMYISGSYWVSKKSVMEEFPLNEKLSWGDSEDVDWSYRVRVKYDFKMNANSEVKLLKWKFRNWDESTQDEVKNKIYKDEIFLQKYNIIL